MSDKLLTTADVAARFQCSRKQVLALARRAEVGVSLGGSAGFRFTEADVEKMRDSLPQVGAA